MGSFYVVTEMPSPKAYVAELAMAENLSIFVLNTFSRHPTAVVNTCYATYTCYDTRFSIFILFKVWHVVQG